MGTHDRRRDGAAVPGRRGRPTPCARRSSCSPATARRCSSPRAAARPASSRAPTCSRRWSHDGVRHARGPRRPGARPELRLRRPRDPPELDLRAAARRASSSRTTTTRARPTRRGARWRTRSGSWRAGTRRAFASGMAATHALLTAVCSAGDHVIIPDDLYGGTYRLVDKILARFGVAYDMVDQRDLDAVRAAIRPETKLVWVETPTNPTLNVVDLPRGDRRGRAGRARRGRQHVRDAGQPAPAGVRRGRGRALDHEVPRRPLRHRRRRGRRRRPGAARGGPLPPAARSAPCPARSTASSCTAGCARCTCGWRPTPRTGWR